MSGALLIDGSYGEGGGQLVRSAVALAAILGRAIEIERVRAGRPRPGLAAQHLTAVRAVGSACGARIAGDALGSPWLAFEPLHAPRAGVYELDVGEARAGGSAGSAALVVQPLALALAFARGESRVVVRGGTHVPSAPCADFLRDVWAPVLARVGLAIECELARPGWFPLGQGEIRARIDGRGPEAPLVPLAPSSRGAIVRAWGRALASLLPEHVAERMARTARDRLEAEGIAARVDAIRPDAACAGAAVFLGVEFGRSRAGFTAFGRRGVPAERVAADAVLQVLAHRESGAAFDAHLGDQLVLPLALAPGESRFTVERASRHLSTQAWLADRFGLASVSVEQSSRGPASVVVRSVRRL